MTTARRLASAIENPEHVQKVLVYVSAMIVEQSRRNTGMFNQNTTIFSRTYSECYQHSSVPSVFNRPIIRKNIHVSQHEWIGSQF